MPSREANGKAKVTNQLPNKRERAASQYGQYDAANATDWSGSEPESLKEALDRIAAALGPIA